MFNNISYSTSTTIRADNLCFCRTRRREAHVAPFANAGAAFFFHWIDILEWQYALITILDYGLGKVVIVKRRRPSNLKLDERLHVRGKEKTAQCNALPKCSNKT